MNDRLNINAEVPGENGLVAIDATVLWRPADNKVTLLRLEIDKEKSPEIAAQINRLKMSARSYETAGEIKSAKTIQKAVDKFMGNLQKAIQPQINKFANDIENLCDKSLKESLDVRMEEKNNKLSFN